MRLKYCQLLCSTHKLRCAKVQDCFPISAFDLIRNATLWQVTSCDRLCYLWRLFNVRKHSFHLTGTCSKNRGRLQSVGWHESSCYRYYNIIHGLVAFFQLCRAWLTTKKTGSRLVGRRRNLPSNSFCQVLSSFAGAGLLENRYLSALFAISPSLRFPPQTS